MKDNTDSELHVKKPVQHKGMYTLGRSVTWSPRAVSKQFIVRSTKACRNVRNVITYICISVQVRFLKDRNFCGK